MSEIKVGCRVKCIDNRGAVEHFVVGDIYTVRKIDEASIVYVEEYQSDAIGMFAHRFEVYNEPFTKASLKDGMRVVYRSGSIRVVCGKHIRRETASVSAQLIAFTEDLKSDTKDIMEVYAAPDKCEDFFNLEVKGPLLWKREERELVELNGKQYYKEDLEDLEEVLKLIKPVGE